jgi:hypothetical protein
MKWIIVILFLGIAGIFLPDASAQAQNNDDEVLQLSGYVLASDSLVPIPDVHILNKKSRIGTTSDAKGFFQIPIHRNDTILLSAVGYESREFVLDPSSRSSNPLVTVKLISKTYVLKEVDVYALPTEEQFKENFLSLKLPEEPKLDIPGIKEPKLSKDVVFLPNGGVGVVGPFSAIYNKFSREGRELKKAQGLYAQESQKQRYDAKFNVQLVGRVTGLKDADLEEFMKYCKLPESVVLNAENEYELVLAINDCFKDYKQMKGMN